MIQKAITKNSLLLGIFALVVSTSLAITEISTHNLRRDSERQVKSQALEQIIPNEKRNNIYHHFLILVLTQMKEIDRKF